MILNEQTFKDIYKNSSSLREAQDSTYGLRKPILVAAHACNTAEIAGMKTLARILFEVADELSILKDPNNINLKRIIKRNF